MSKRIDDLPQDIYNVLEKGVKFTDQDCSEMVEMLKQRLAPQGEEAKGQMRMSGFGDPCLRKQWFKVNMPEEAEPIDGQTRLKFLYGDIIELLIIKLAEKAGHSVEGKQDTVELEGLVGHRDGIFDGMVADVKSANSRGMAKFKNHTVAEDDPFGYLDQLSLYVTASAKEPSVKIKKEGAFIAVGKEMADIHIDKYRIKDTDYVQAIKDRRELLASPTPPDRPYDPSVVDRGANLSIPVVPCGYCAFKQRCYAEANNGKGLIGYKNKYGPRWYIKITKQPDGLLLTREVEDVSAS